MLRNLTTLSAFLLTSALVASSVAACGTSGTTGETSSSEDPPAPAATSTEETASDAGLSEAIFAGGCFWCMEPPFDKIDGVTATISGYIGGEKDNPTYREVSSGGTGHAEAVKIVYDPGKVSYNELLEVFWHNIDPTVKDRQFCDGGSQYRTGIFYLGDQQKAGAEASKQEIVDSGRFDRVVTEVTAATTFYPAEDYHQDFYEKSPVRYKSYRIGCGRDRRLEELWGDAG